MKLIFCPACTDVVALSCLTWRRCICGASGGQYHADGVTATIGGLARVFGIHNRFLFTRVNWLTGREKADLLVGWGRDGKNIWWGGEDDDDQIFRVAPAETPPWKTEQGNKEVL
jgi:hypothetical protein